MTDPDPQPTAGVPRWVKLIGAAALLLLVAIAVLHLTGVAPHGH